MIAYHLANNPPATSSDIARVEVALGQQLPSCLCDVLLERNGFQVYKNHQYEGSKWLNDRSIHATHESAIDMPEDMGTYDFGKTIIDETQRLRDLYEFFAEEEDKNDGVDHDPHMMDTLICVGKWDDRIDEQFTYWMPAGKDSTDVYCIEMPIEGQYPLGYSYPPPIRDHLEAPLYTWDQFLKFMDVASG